MKLQLDLEFQGDRRNKVITMCHKNNFPFLFLYPTFIRNEYFLDWLSLLIGPNYVSWSKQLYAFCQSIKNMTKRTGSTFIFKQKEHLRKRKETMIHSYKSNLLVRLTNQTTTNVCLWKAKKIENNIVRHPQAAASVSGRSLLTITGVQYTALVLMIRLGMCQDIYKQKLTQ